MLKIWSWRAWNTAAETDMVQCVCGKPFLIRIEVWDPRKTSAWVGEEGCREEDGGE